MNKQQILEKMTKSRSWKELGLTIAEVYEAFSDNVNGDETIEEIAKLKEKVERLSEANKQLRNENKMLRGQR